MGRTVDMVKTDAHRHNAMTNSFMDGFLNNDGVMSSAVEDAWTREVSRRRDEYLSNEVSLIPAKEVFKRAIAKYA